MTDFYEEKEIGGRTYITEMYPVEYHITMENKLGQLLGGLTGLAGADKGDGIDGRAIADTVSGLFKSLESLGGPRFYEAVLAHTQIIQKGADGKLHKSKVSLNDFRGRMAELKHVTIWVLRYNFEAYLKDAFGPLGGLLEVAKARLAEKSLNMPGNPFNDLLKTPETTSSGESGRS